MKVLEQMRTRLHDQLLHKKAPTQKVVRNSISLEKAQTIGILFDATRPEDRDTVLKYAGKLEKAGKKVTLLGFFNTRLKSASFPFKFFDKKNLDLALRPKNPISIEFADRTFDLLLNLSNKKQVPLNYVAALSKAKFRVGPSINNTFCYDLMIEHDEKKGLTAFIEQIVHYLGKMKPEPATEAV